MKKELFHLFYCIKQKKKPITSGDYGLKVLKLLEEIEKKIN